MSNDRTRRRKNRRALKDGDCIRKFSISRFRHPNLLAHLLLIQPTNSWLLKRTAEKDFACIPRQFARYRTWWASSIVWCLNSAGFVRINNPKACLHKGDHLGLSRKYACCPKITRHKKARILLALSSTRIRIAQCLQKELRRQCHVWPSSGQYSLFSLSCCTCIV